MITVNRRARSHPDRGGDPLDGLVNLFDLGIVLAVAFMLAALSSLKLSDLLTKDDVTVIHNTNGQNTVLIKKGQQVHTINLKPGQKTAGQGHKIGTVYQLQDGRTILVKPK